MDYGKRLKNDDAPEDLFQWLGKILFDDQVYGVDDRALAFEICIGERIAESRAMLDAATPTFLYLPAAPTRLQIYWGVLDENAPWERRSAFWKLLADSYGKHWSWIEEIGRARERIEAGFAESSGGRLFADFCLQIQTIAPSLVGDESVNPREIARMEAEVGRAAETIKTLEGDLDFAEDRAQRAHAKLKKQDDEIQRLRRLVTEGQENGEKLRSERRTRITSQRQSGQSQRDLEVLRREYVKLDTRLQEMAKRLAQSEQGQAQRVNQWDLSVIRKLNVDQLLGVAEGKVSSEDLGQIRRRFAAALHPDRVRGMPLWVSTLFAEMLVIINEACDRIK